MPERQLGKLVFITFAILLCASCSFGREDISGTVDGRYQDLKILRSFAFLQADNPDLSRDFDAEIVESGQDRTVVVGVPAETDRTALVPAFTIEGRGLSINGVSIQSGSTPADCSPLPSLLTVHARNNTRLEYELIVLEWLVPVLALPPAADMQPAVLEDGVYRTAATSVPIAVSFNYNVSPATLTGSDFAMGAAAAGTLTAVDPYDVFRINADYASDGEVTVSLPAGRVEEAEYGLTNEESNTVSFIFDRTPPYPSDADLIRNTLSETDRLVVQWSEAVDNYAADDAVEYKLVVTSTALDDAAAYAASAGDAGVLYLADWASSTGCDLDNTLYPGIGPGMEFFFHVLVRDDLGNWSTYGSASFFTDFELGTTVTFIGVPAAGMILFDPATDVTVAVNDPLTVNLDLSGLGTVSQMFYTLDGEVLTQSDPNVPELTETSVTILCGDSLFQQIASGTTVLDFGTNYYTVGTHVLTCHVITAEGASQSYQLSFNVGTGD